MGGRDSSYYDALETRDPQVREAADLARLPGHLEHARERSAFYRDLLKEIDPRTVTSRAALARLPVTRKSELHDRQRARPPFGGLEATPITGLARIFMSPGPIYDPEARRPDFWQSARMLHAAGFRPGAT